MNRLQSLFLTLDRKLVPCVDDTIRLGHIQTQATLFDRPAHNHESILFDNPFYLSDENGTPVKYDLKEERLRLSPMASDELVGRWSGCETLRQQIEVFLYSLYADQL